MKKIRTSSPNRISCRQEQEEFLFSVKEKILKHKEETHFITKEDALHMIIQLSKLTLVSHNLSKTIPKLKTELRYIYKNIDQQRQILTQTSATNISHYSLRSITPTKEVSCFSNAHLTQDFEAVAGLQFSKNEFLKMQEYVEESIADIETTFFTNTDFKTMNTSTDDATNSNNTISEDSGNSSMQTLSEVISQPVKTATEYKKKIPQLQDVTTQQTPSKVCEHWNSPVLNKIVIPKRTYRKRKTTQKKNVSRKNSIIKSNTGLQENCENKQSSTSINIQLKNDESFHNKLKPSTESSLKVLKENCKNKQCSTNMNKLKPGLNKSVSTLTQFTDEDSGASADFKQDETVMAIDFIYMLDEFDKMVNDFRSFMISKLETNSENLNDAPANSVPEECNTLGNDNDELDLFFLEDEYKQFFKSEEGQHVENASTSPTRLPNWEKHLNKYKKINSFNTSVLD